MHWGSEGYFEYLYFIIIKFMVANFLLILWLPLIIKIHVQGIFEL